MKSSVNAIVNVILIAWVGLVAGCGGEFAEGRHYPVSLRTLAVKEPSVVHGNAELAVLPITQGNWLKYREILQHLFWKEANTDTVGGSGSGMQGAITAAGASVLRYDDFPLLTLPAFIVQIANRGDQPLSFAHAQFRLEDGHGRVFSAITRIPDVEARVRGDLVERHPELLQPGNVQLLGSVHENIEKMQLLDEKVVVPPGGSWRGYLPFRIEARDPEEFGRIARDLTHLTLRITGTEAAQERAEFTFTFDVVQRPISVVCADGTKAPSASKCRKGPMADTPIDGGPCVQETVIPFKTNRTQLWVGSTAVANSDLNRTLLATPVTKRIIKRGIVFRWTGYALIAAGIMGALGTSVGIAQVNSKIAPAGLAVLGLAVAGIGFTAAGVKRTDEAVRVYNEEADATGQCAPVW